MSTIKVNKILSADNPEVDVADGLTVTGEVKVGSAVTVNSTGIDATGVITATSFKGSGANLTNIPDSAITALTASKLTGALPAISGANLTGIDATSIKDSSGNVKIQGNNSGATVTGVITAVGGNSTEGAFLKGTAVGVGTTTNAGLAAGVSTAAGTLTFNTTVGLQCYMGDDVGWKNVASFVTATGGSKSTAAGKTIHTFTSSGAFTLTDGAPTCDILIVGGGGAGGQDVAGGGGAGGMVEGTITLPGPGTFPVTVGNGGSNASTGGDTPAPGGNSSWTVPVGTITAAGGGRGQGASHFPGTSTAGGSSGGGHPSSQSATQPGLNPGISGITQYGNPGGAWPGPGGNGGGGGGAGGAGSADGYGGIGRASSISGASVTYAGGGDGADQPNGKGGPGSYGHPGGGGYNSGSPGPQPHRNGENGKGGGGAAGYGSWSSGGNGGSGIVIISY